MPTPTAVRRATSDDFEAWLALFEEVAAEGLWLGSEAPLDRDRRRETFERGLSGEDAVTLLTGTDALTGAIGLSHSGGLVDLGMFVARGHRGEGCGRALLEAGVEWARKRDAHKVSLAVWTHNHAARALYARCGFVEEGTRRRHWRRRNGELWDATFMGLVLDEAAPGGPQAQPPAEPLRLPGDQLAVEGLVLRPWRAADIPAIPAAVDDPAVQRWLDRIPHPYGLADASAFVAGAATAATAGTALQLAVTHGGSLIGSIGLRRESDRAVARVGFWVAAPARRRGVARNALGALSDWALDSGAFRRLELYAAEANVAPRGVAERAGFELEGIHRAWRLVHGQPTDFAAYARVAPTATGTGPAG